MSLKERAAAANQGGGGEDKKKIKSTTINEQLKIYKNQSTSKNLP